jgi:hypothetical protein
MVELKTAFQPLRMRSEWSGQLHATSSQLPGSWFRSYHDTNNGYSCVRLAKPAVRVPPSARTRAHCQCERSGPSKLDVILRFPVSTPIASKLMHTGQCSIYLQRKPLSQWHTKIERIIVLLSASPEGEARLPMPKGMAYKE